jgi:Cys-tRNA(Pro) deacylase
METPAIAAVTAAGLAHRVVTYGRVRDLDEAAAKRGIAVDRIIKTLVIRRGDDDYLFVLVPGDRVIDWPRLRAHLGVTRVSLADADDALAVTGYPRGAITPFGSRTRLPVIADEGIGAMGEVSVGGGAHGVAIHLEGAILVEHLEAQTVRVTRPR